MLIDFTVIQEILSDPEWRKRWQSAVTHEEIRKVISDYLKEKREIEKAKPPPRKILTYACVEHGIYEFIEPVEKPVTCPECGKVMTKIGEFTEEI